MGGSTVAESSQRVRWWAGWSSPPFLSRFSPPPACLPADLLHPPPPPAPLAHRHPTPCLVLFPPPPPPPPRLLPVAPATARKALSGLRGVAVTAVDAPRRRRLGSQQAGSNDAVHGLLLSELRSKGGVRSAGGGKGGGSGGGGTLLVGGEGVRGCLTCSEGGHPWPGGVAAGGGRPPAAPPLCRRRPRGRQGFGEIVGGGARPPSG